MGIAKFVYYNLKGVSQPRPIRWHILKGSINYYVLYTDLLVIYQQSCTSNFV